jgi:hypothetical protein
MDGEGAGIMQCVIGRKTKLLARMALLQLYVGVLLVCTLGYTADDSVAVGRQSSQLAIHLGGGMIGFGFAFDSNVANVKLRNGFSYFDLLEYPPSSMDSYRDEFHRRLIENGNTRHWRFQTGSGWSASYCSELPVSSNGECFGSTLQYSVSEGDLRWHHYQLEIPAWQIVVAVTLLLFWHSLFRWCCHTSLSRS